MTILMARTAPKRDAVLKEIDELLRSRDEEVPPDGVDRVDYRLGIALGCYDDDDPDDPTQPVRDLLTDILWLCHGKGWDIDYLVERAEWMRNEEAKEWSGVADE